MKNVIEKYRAEINYFIEVLKQDSNICLDNFYRNLKTLKIYESDAINDSPNADAAYDYKTNKIILTPKSFKLQSFYHELFHMASRTKKNNILYDGFLAINTSNNQEYGRGLNEGYTELLCERYFGTATDYYIERIFLKQIEKILGESLLKEHYFSPRDESIFEELEKYTSDEETSNFFRNLDYYTFVAERDDNKITEADLQELIDNCVLFLYKAYMNKLSQKGEDSDEDKINEYINGFTLAEVEVVPIGTIKIIKSLIDKGLVVIEDTKKYIK